MTVYDLDKLAKPLPWKDNTGKGECVNSPELGTYNGNTTDWVCIVQDDDARKATNTLICHIRNNFMKALEALKEEHAITVSFEAERASSTPHCPELCDVCELIKELETVQ